jgi:hypothetical protein
MGQTMKVKIKDRVEDALIWVLSWFRSKYMPGRVPGERSLVWWSGFVLIAVGIGALTWSRLLVSGSETPVTGWWQGTLQAMGVGLIVGGLVDVLAISGLNRVMLRRARINDSWRRVLQSYQQQYPKRGNEYEMALDALVQKHWSQIQYLDPDLRKILDTSGTFGRLLHPYVRRPFKEETGMPD